MKKIARLAVVASLGLFVVVAQASTIADVEAMASGSHVTLDANPVVTAVLSQPGTVNGITYTNWAVPVNDGTGSMFLFGHLPASGTYTPTVGDAITAAGTYSPFHQIPELGTLTALSSTSSGNPVPNPLDVTIPQINVTTLPFSVAGYLLTLHDVTISAGSDPLNANGLWGTSNKSWTVTDASNNSMVLFYWPSSYSTANANLANMLIPTTPVDITGIVSVFTSGSTSTAEFTPMSATPEPAGLLLVLVGLALRRR